MLLPFDFAAFITAVSCTTLLPNDIKFTFNASKLFAAILTSIVSANTFCDISLIPPFTLE